MTFKSTRTKEWRDQVNTLCATTTLSASVIELLDEADKTDEKTREACSQMLDHWRGLYMDALNDSLNYANAYKMSYIRNFMWAIWKYENNGCDDYKGVFMPAFINRFFGLTDAILHEKMKKEQISKELDEAAKLDGYMHTLTWYYCNRLCNLADGGDRKIPSNNSPEHDKLLQLHRQLEAEGQFDEILMIRNMLINLVMSAFGMHLKGDEAANRVFQVEAFEILNEMNSKPVMVA